MNSKNKGKVGERQFAKLCRDHGYDARRGQQYNGLDGDDVVGLPGIHIEVKRYGTLTDNIILEALGQSLRDCKAKNIAIVAHREDYAKWYITMDASDLSKMLTGEEGKYEGVELLPVTMLADDWFRIYRESGIEQ